MVSAAPRGGVVAAASDQHVTEAADCRAAGVPVGEGEGASLDDRERGALRRRGDGDSAARFLLERDAYLVARQVERLGEVVADLDREGLAEGALVAEAAQVELERFRLEAKRSRRVLDRGDIEVGLAGDRADGGEFVAGHLDVRYAWIGERLQAGVVLRDVLAEREELGITCARFYSRTLSR